MAEKTPKFQFGQTLYHVCDPLQQPLIVTGVVHRGEVYTYLVSTNDSEKECSDIELSNEKTIF